LHHYDCIQAQQREVGEVVFGDSFAAEMGQDESQSAKPIASTTCPTEFRNENLVCVTNDDFLDFTPAIDQQSNLAIALE